MRRSTGTMFQLQSENAGVMDEGEGPEDMGDTDLFDGNDDGTDDADDDATEGQDPKWPIGPGEEPTQGDKK